MNIQKPKMSPLTIVLCNPPLVRTIIIEALTPEAAQWVQEIAAQFGSLYREAFNAPQWSLIVHYGYDRDEVAEYLRDLWNSQQWPEEVEAGDVVAEPEAK